MAKIKRSEVPAHNVHCSSQRIEGAAKRLVESRTTQTGSTAQTAATTVEATQHSRSEELLENGTYT